MYWFENLDKSYSDTKSGILNKRSKAVIGTNVKTGEVISFHSQQEAGRNGFHRGNISSCCSGRLKTHKGYIWKFK